DDYLFAQGIPAAVRVSLYQLTKAEPGSNLAIEFVANPVGTAMALAAAGADAVLPDGGDLIVNPVGALRSNTVLLAGDVAKVVTGRDVADDLVENIGFHGLGAKGGRRPTQGTSRRPGRRDALCWSRDRRCRRVRFVL
ncbi:MAG TPA: hypothetical protein PLF91_15350, partial [Mycolicibacterium fallax]|nr:hypothetical protein [Mycolicibacterium fallax]